MRRRSDTDSWRQEVHPVFIELAEAFKEAILALKALGPNPPGELAAAIQARMQEKSERIRQSYPSTYQSTVTDGTFSNPFELIFVGSASGSPMTERDINQGFIEELYWKRYSEPLWIALQKAEAGDLAAYRRVMRIGEDYELLREGKGPIKPPKTHVDHNFLLMLGLDMGLNKLGAEELANCFDALCPCGEPHDADALKKQRARVVKSLRRATAWFQQDRAKIPSREWLFVYGRDGLFAKAIQDPQTKSRLVVAGEIGKQPECCINEGGEVSCTKASRFNRRPSLRKLLAAFEVDSPRELFAMFFPGADSF